MSIGSANAIFKAQAFKALAARERRFGDMLRLVKAWAGAHGLNDAAEGTFNSFALGLMVGPPLSNCQHHAGNSRMPTFLSLGACQTPWRFPSCHADSQHLASTNSSKCA